MNIFVEKNEFTVRQTRIYNEIEENALNLDRLKKAEFRNNGGYIIALRHSDNVIEIIKELNEKISEIIPIMKYDEFNIHTTMASFGECPEFKPWLYRVKFGIPATNLATKGDSITFSTPTIEGTILRRNKADAGGKHPWKAEALEGDVTAATITNWYKEVYEPTYTTTPEKQG